MEVERCWWSPVAGTRCRALGSRHTDIACLCPPVPAQAAKSLVDTSSIVLTIPAPRKELVAPTCPRQKVQLSPWSVLGEAQALHGDPSLGVSPQNQH